MHSSDLTTTTSPTPSPDALLDELARTGLKAAPGLALGETFRTTFAEIRSHLFRSFLTLIGVVLGSLAVLVMVSFIEAIKVMVWDGIKSLGYDGVMFVSARASEVPLERKKSTMSRGLGIRDARDLSEWSESYSGVAAMSITQSVVRGAGVEQKVYVFGVNPAYAKVRNRSVTAGRWIDEGDEIERRSVAVVGSELATTMFGSDNPIGKQIRVGANVFVVVGVGQQIGNRMANDGGDSWTQREMEGLVVPLETYRARIRGGERVAVLMIKSEDNDKLPAVRAETERLMRRAHHGIGDFEVEDVASEIVRAEKEIDDQLFNWTVILTSLAGISLLVGGVGIYSVMKISLTERLYEIGLRKAIGASDRVILLQFLVESSTLSALGGVLGCLFGAVLCKVLGSNFEAGLPVAPLGLVLALGFAFSVGVFAGFFPSLHASRLTPIEALRG
jgi:putative ABC transport system permease protein